MGPGWLRSSFKLDWSHVRDGCRQASLFLYRQCGMQVKSWFDVWCLPFFDWNPFWSTKNLFPAIDLITPQRSTTTRPFHLYIVLLLPRAVPSVEYSHNAVLRMQLNDGKTGCVSGHHKKPIRRGIGWSCRSSLSSPEEETKVEEVEDNCDWWWVTFSFSVFCRIAHSKHYARIIRPGLLVGSGSALHPGRPAGILIGLCLVGIVILM